MVMLMVLRLVLHLIESELQVSCTRVISLNPSLTGQQPFLDLESIPSRRFRVRACFFDYGAVLGNWSHSGCREFDKVDRSILDTGRAIGRCRQGPVLEPGQCKNMRTKKTGRSTSTPSQAGLQGAFSALLY